jgi:hypothetical protein
MALDGEKTTRLDEQVPLAILEAPTPPAELLQDRASSDTATTPAVDRVLSGESDLDPKKPDPDDGDTGMSAEQRAREAKYLTGGAYSPTHPSRCLCDQTQGETNADLR